MEQVSLSLLRNNSINFKQVLALMMYLVLIFLLPTNYYSLKQTYL